MGWSELVDTLRENFERKYSESVKNGSYDQRDVDRLYNDFRFARSYIRGRERLEEGADLINTSFLFRKEYKIHDVSEETFCDAIRNIGALYFRNRDVNGSRILWLKVQLHRKDAKPEYIHEEKLGLASALEKAFNEEPLKPVVAVLDMTGCGLVNLDIDFVKYIITCFKFYYPTFLEYMLIYDMPWIFNAAWKIVKAWLSAEAAAKIKFVTKSSVQTYIHVDSLPLHMGGTDDYKFVYTPGMSLEPLYPEDEKPDEKKVKFESAEPVVEEMVTPTNHDAVEGTPQHSNDVSTKVNGLSRNNSNRSTASNTSLRHRSSISSNTNNNSNDKANSLTQQKSSANNTYVGRFLSISPADQLTFLTDGSGDAYDVISLSNTLALPVAFKVKTTSPEKYRVRPSLGVVRPGKIEEVFVYLTEEHKSSSTSKDKFLIMAMEVKGQSLEDSARLWKDVPKENIMEHRLKCVTASKKEEPATSSMKEMTRKDLQPVTLDEKISRLELQNQYMRKQLNLLISIQVVTAVFFLVILFSYSCLGEELFTRYLALPFDFCSDSYGRKC